MFYEYLIVDIYLCLIELKSVYFVKVVRISINYAVEVSGTNYLNNLWKMLCLLDLETHETRPNVEKLTVQMLKH